MAKSAVAADKSVTVESLYQKHMYDENTYLKKIDNGTLVLTNKNDANPTDYNSPALVVGGVTTEAHLEIDTNEILAKRNETTADNLFLNDDVERDGVRVGVSGSIDIYKTGVMPRVETNAETGATTLKSIDIGATDKPFNHMYGVNYNLYNKYNSRDTDYGALRVGFTENEDETRRPTAVLELGNNNDVDSVDSRITMYGNGKSFTNILPNDAESGSNKVTLPLQSGMLAISKTGEYQGWQETGTSTKPITLKFGFNPSILFVWKPNSTVCRYGIFFRNSNGMYYDSEGNTKIIKADWTTNNQISWYTEESNTIYALSGAGGETYNYLAI